MTEAIIKTSFGEIRITYSTTEQLGAALEGLEEQIKMTTDIASKVAPPPPKIPKVGFENAYQFLPGGSVQLLYIPPTLLHLVVLALFAYYPETVTIAELEKATGIDDVTHKVLWQANNRKYFRKANDTYGLTPDGLSLAIKKVKPLIETATRSKEE